MSFVDDSDLQPDSLHTHAGTDSLLMGVEAAKQQVLQRRASFHCVELEQVLEEQRSGRTNTMVNGIEEAVREYTEESSQTSGPSVDSKELLEHPQRMPNLLRGTEL